MAMKTKDKWILGLTCGVVALLLVGALIYAGVENIRTSNARMDREEAEAVEIQRQAHEKARVQRLAEKAKFEAWSQTPEGKTEMAKRQAQTQKMREQQAQADEIVKTLKWKPWQDVAKAFQELGFDTLPSSEPKSIRAVVPFNTAVKITNYEIVTICKMAYNRLGEGSFVLLQDPAGTQLGQADGWNAKGYK
jgi:hypothetical protein